jgi:pimeloyl-ACP methyl ester carboxylesterase
MRRRGRGFVANLKGATGFLVGTVLKVVTRPEPTLHSDPRWRSRLAELESRYRYLADACPNLHEVEREAHHEAMVFVHGTMSCGMVSLKDLFGLAVEGYSVPGHVYRYEHDTFLPLKDNADELADWIERKLRISRRLVIAAHSRGGLVAVSAAARLMKNRYPAEIVVRSFGTPFRGTPLVAIGKKALTLLAKLGEEISTAVPVPVLSALAKGFFYLFDSPTLPPGIMAMQEGPGVLDYVQDAAGDVSLESWASHYDVDGGNAGFGASVEGVLLGALQGAPHDLVVPMASAIHCGKSVVPVLRCSHVHYFRQPPVKHAIMALLAPPPSGAAATAGGPAAGSSPPGAGVPAGAAPAVRAATPSTSASWPSPATFALSRRIKLREPKDARAEDDPPE